MDLEAEKDVSLGKEARGSREVSSPLFTRSQLEAFENMYQKSPLIYGGWWRNSTISSTIAVIADGCPTTT